MSMEQREFRIGYNLLWRLTFFLFAICMLLASILLLVQTLLGTSEGLLVPSSMLVAAILMSFYLIPFISTRQQMLVVTTGGLQLVGDHSRIVLPWESVAGVRFKRVMLVMPYLIIALSSKEQFAQFIDENPRSFLSKWTAHVGGAPLVSLASAPAFLSAQENDHGRQARVAREKIRWGNRH
jgi:hypothetical protein